MEDMIRKNRVGRPPLPLPPPPRSQAPSALVPPMPSQHGRQPQLMMMANVGDGRGRKPHLGMDDRKLRQLLSNRVSAQKSRLRKANYINELENQVKELEAMIATFSTEVIVCQERKRLLLMENNLVKQKNAMVEEQLNLKNEEANVYNGEITKLQNGFLLQQLPDQTWMSPSPSGPMNYTTNQDMSQLGCPSQNFGMSVLVPVPVHFPVPEEMASQAFQLA